MASEIFISFNIYYAQHYLFIVLQIYQNYDLKCSLDIKKFVYQRAGNRVKYGIWSWYSSRKIQFMSLKCLVRDFVMKTWCPMLWSTQGSGLLMSSQTMAQARRTRLKRALTEVTSDTVSYVRTVGNQSQIKHNTLYQNNIWSFNLYRIPMAF